MEKLLSLVRILRPGEKELLRNLYRSNRAGDRILRSMLFELIVSGKVSSDEDARMKLRGAHSASSYSHLKTRLREDILSVLLLQESHKRIAQANRAAVFECWKKMTQAYVLIFRGAKTEGADILRSAERLADKYELAAEKLLIRHLIRETLYSITDVQDLNKMNEGIQKDLNTFKNVLRSEEISFLITVPSLKREMLTKEGSDFENHVIQELEGLYQQDGTARIGFWYYMAQTDYLASSGRHSEAIEHGLEFLKLVEESPSIRSKNNIAGVNLTLGTSFLQTRTFDRAQIHFSDAVELFPKSGFNRLQALEFLTKTESALEQYNSALKHAEEALAHPRINQRESLMPKWLFLKASLEFLVNDVDESFKTLNQDGGFLLRNSDQWNTQFRILEMLQLVEFADEEWLEFKYNAARRFFNRHKELLTPRVSEVMAIISALIRNGLDFKAMSEARISSINECLNGENGKGWDPMSPEIVQFDKWVSQKIPGRFSRSDQGSGE